VEVLLVLVLLHRRQGLLQVRRRALRASVHRLALGLLGGLRLHGRAGQLLLQEAAAVERVLPAVAAVVDFMNRFRPEFTNKT
jgi:hypothetical protein